MEEEKKKKMGDKSIIIIAVAVLLIAAGAILILTGNNKSLLSNDKKEEKKEEEIQEPTDDPKRGMDPTRLKDEDARELIDKAKQERLPEEPWSVGMAKVIAHGNNDTFLVDYEQVDEEGFVSHLLTIITYKDGVGTVGELPGWFEGERDLAEYGFVTYEDETTQEPVEEPQEPTEEVPNLAPETPNYDPEAEQPTGEPVAEQPAVEQPAVEQPTGEPVVEQPAVVE